MSTPNTQAVAGLNALNGMMGQIASLRQQINDFVLQYNDNNWSATWAAMATAALNADGTLGTADSAPVSTHPIDNRYYAALARSTTSGNYVNAVSMLEALQAFLTGGAVSSSNRNAVLDLFVGG